MGEGSPVGKGFTMWRRKGRIIGVVEDHNIEPVKKTIPPLALFVSSDLTQYLFIRLHPSNIPDSLEAIEAAWKNAAPAFPFEYRFLDLEFDRLYKSEERMGTLFNSFTFLALFISALGLVGLAAFFAQRKTKEIGIRKVLGASSACIVYQQGKEFVLLVALANALVWPLAYYTAWRWLKGYAFHASLGIWTFLAAGLLTLVVAVVSVGYQSIRAALTDPVDSLRYE
jgi:putative ABC transport system permease protein